MDYSPPSSSVHGLFQARILELVAISFSSRSFLPRDWTHVSCFGRHWEADSLPLSHQGVMCISICCCSVAQSCPTLCDPMDCSTQASLSFTISWSWLKLLSIEPLMPSNHLILCRPLLLLPSIFPASGYFQMSQFFTLDGQSIGASASTSVLPVNIQDWFPLGLTGWISLQPKGPVLQAPLWDFPGKDIGVGCHFLP